MSIGGKASFFVVKESAGVIQTEEDKKNNWILCFVMYQSVTRFCENKRLLWVCFIVSGLFYHLNNFICYIPDRSLPSGQRKFGNTETNSMEQHKHFSIQWYICDRPYENTSYPQKHFLGGLRSLWNPFETRFLRVWNPLKTLLKPFGNTSETLWKTFETLWKLFWNPFETFWNSLETLWNAWERGNTLETPYKFFAYSLKSRFEKNFGGKIFLYM